MDNTIHKLIAVVGTSPAVVTETAWYLTQKERVPLREVLALTTTDGKDTLEKALFGEQDRWHQFCREYDLDIDFGHRRIKTLTGATGASLSDIRTLKESQGAAEHIVRFVREQAADPSVVLHCSVAGGRKTMSVLLAFALQLFGRPQDRLLHVLISPPELEKCKDFFYPPRKKTVFKVEGKMIRPDTIKVEVAAIPFVCLGHMVSPSWLNQDYATLVQRTQQSLGDIKICLDLERRQVEFAIESQPSLIVRLGEKKTKGHHLTAMQAACYSYFLLKAKDHPYHRDIEPQVLLRRLYDHFYKAGQKAKEISRFDNSTKSQMRRTIKQALEKHFLPGVIDRVQVSPRDDSIALDPDRITIKGRLP